MVRDTSCKYLFEKGGRGFPRNIYFVMVTSRVRAAA